MSARFGGGYEGIPIQHGLLVEQDMFDKVKLEARLDFEKAIRESFSYAPYEQCITFVKNAQPAPPARPSKPFAAALQEGLVKKLYGKSTLASSSKVRFYTGVSSALDIYHGTDAFFEINPDSGLTLPRGNRVTLGVTTRDKGDEPIKTDVEIWVPNEGLDKDTELFQYAVSQVVDEILKRGGGSPSGIVDVHVQ